MNLLLSHLILKILGTVEDPHSSSGKRTRSVTKMHREAKIIGIHSRPPTSLEVPEKFSLPSTLLESVAS